MTRAELERLFTNERGAPLQRLTWWDEAEAALDTPDVVQVVIWAPRQSGKSQFLAKEAVYQMLERPGCYILFLTAAESQAQAVFARKFRRPVEKLLRELNVSRRSVILTKRSLELLDLGSKLEVVATSEDTTPGRSVDLLILDEGRDIEDQVYATLLPSVLAADGGKVLAASTAGRPKGWFYALVTHPDETTRVIEATNENPHAQRGKMDAITRLLGRIAPGFRDRELLNRFSDDAVNALLPLPLIERALDPTLGELPTSEAPAFAGVDLARRKDLASLVVVVREPARQPEARDHLRVASIQTWDPKASATGEVDFAQIRAALAALPTRFPKLERVLVDEGAEGGSIMPFARAHPALTFRVEGFHATVDSNMAIWSALAGRLHGGTLTLPKHQRLIDELVNLRQEEISLGAKWRVLDASKKFHRDVAVALALAVHGAGEFGAPAFGVFGDDAVPDPPARANTFVADVGMPPRADHFWGAGTRQRMFLRSYVPSE